MLTSELILCTRHNYWGQLVLVCDPCLESPTQSRDLLKFYFTLSTHIDVLLNTQLLTIKLEWQYICQKITWLVFFPGLHPSKIKLELQRHLASLNNLEQASVFENTLVCFPSLSPLPQGNIFVCGMCPLTSTFCWFFLLVFFSFLSLRLTWSLCQIFFLYSVDLVDKSLFFLSYMCSSPKPVLF